MMVIFGRQFLHFSPVVDGSPPLRKGLRVEYFGQVDDAVVERRWGIRVEQPECGENSQNIEAGILVDFYLLTVAFVGFLKN